MGGFSLHKWMANNTKLLNFPVAIRAETKLENSCFNLLGLNWCPNTDHSTFDFELDQLKTDLTKKQVLSAKLNFLTHLDGLHKWLLQEKFFFKSFGKLKS